MANELTLPFDGTGSNSRTLFSITNTSTDADAGQDTNFAIGVMGRGPGGFGYLGGKDPVFEGLVGVYGESEQNGIFGRTASSVPADHAIYGQNDGAGHAVTGVSTTTGSTGFLAGRDPLFGGAVGVYGESDQRGVFGHSFGGFGVAGLSDAGTGVHGVNGRGAPTGLTVGSGVLGQSEFGNGVSGVSEDAIGIFGKGRVAGHFEGDVEVTGNLTMSSPTGDIRFGDVAEGFSAQDGAIIEPGTVVVLNQDGFVRPGDQAYDRKVAGVVSGAGDYRSAIVLDKERTDSSRLPVALMGKVCCKVDAHYSPIEVGDLLTTSPTPGYAMKAVDPLRVFGSVIGKALRPLQAGQGIIPILIALQ